VPLVERDGTPRVGESGSEAGKCGQCVLGNRAWASSSAAGSDPINRSKRDRRDPVRPGSPTGDHLREPRPDTTAHRKLFRHRQCQSSLEKQVSRRRSGNGAFYLLPGKPPGETSNSSRLPRASKFGKTGRDAPSRAPNPASVPRRTTRIKPNAARRSSCPVIVLRPGRPVNNKLFPFLGTTSSRVHGPNPVEPRRRN